MSKASDVLKRIGQATLKDIHLPLVKGALKFRHVLGKFNIKVGCEPAALRPAFSLLFGDAIKDMADYLNF